MFTKHGNHILVSLCPLCDNILVVCCEGHVFSPSFIFGYSFTILNIGIENRSTMLHNIVTKR